MRESNLRRAPLGRKLSGRARVAHRIAVTVSLLALVAALPDINAGAWQQEEEAQPHVKSQSAFKGEANIIDGAEFVPGEVLVRFRTDAAAEALEAVSLPLPSAKGGEVSLERSGGSEMVSGLRLAKVDPAHTLEAVAELASRSDVLYAEPNYIWRAHRTPNDPRYTSGEMYGLNKIGAPAAWDTTTGSKSVVVGVIDGGVDINHPDLKDNIWANPVEANGIPGVDDDGNGLIDDVNGWDFAHNDRTVFDNEENDHHGTHVAGTIGAKGNNAAGVTGVNWDVSILPIKVLGAEGGSTSNIINGYNYARRLREAGVNLRVLNNSYGGRGKSLAALDAIYQLNDAGILFVASAGNEARDNFIYPAFPANDAAPNVIAVASTDSTDGLSSFSNFSSRLVSIGAPGSNILSTLPISQYPTGYGSLSGTSMAAPHVSGAAALICAAKPGITLSQLRGVLSYTGDRINALEGVTTTGRRLNVANAVNAALENDAAAPAVPGNFRVTGQNGRRFTLAWTAPGDDGNSGASADYDFFFIKPSGTSFLLPTALVPANAGAQQTISIDVPLTNFSGRILLRAYDNAGNASEAFVNVTIPISSKSDPYTVALSPSSGLAPLSGTRLVTGDDKYVSYDLPFSFQFYGVNQTSLTLSTNGTLYFSTPPRRESGDADDAGSTIDGLQGQRMIAGLWDDIDINTSVRPDSGVYVTRPDASRVVFRWQGVTFMTPRVNVNMEIELRSDGTIQMRYGENPRVFPVVGIAGGEPEAYFIVSHTSELENRNAFPRDLSDAQTITFTPRRLGSSVFSISGRVTDARGAAVPNVLVELFGEQNGSRLTDSNGDYSFTDLPEFGNYAVIPSRPNYKFTPTITEIASLTSDQKANFIATYNYVCTQTQQINFGQTVNGVLANGDCLNPAEDDGTLVDRYTFNGTAGQQITISMSSTAIDTVLYLLDSEGSVLTYNDDVDPNSNPPNRNSRIVFTLPQSGFFSIIAGSFAPEERGAYTLSLSLNGTCNLTAINFNETKTGTLSTGDCINEIKNDNTFVDYYTFNGTAGQQISITMTGASGNVDPYLYLLSPSGVVLADDDNGGGGLAARIVPGAAFGRLPATGTYTIVANTLLTSQSGNYSITLTKATADCPPVPLTSGVTVNGSLTTGDCRLLKDSSFLDAYTFAGAAAGQVTITMTSSSPELVPVLYLLTPTGDTLTLDLNNDRDNTARIPSATGAFSLPVPGTYTVIANSLISGQTGNYTLRVDNTPVDTHGISGRVRDGNGVGVPNVNISLGVGSNATTTTNDDGTYSFTNLAADAHYRVTPSHPNYTFGPPEIQIINLNSDSQADFLAIPNRYTISGRVTDSNNNPLADVIVELSGSQSGRMRTDLSGNYAFANLPATGNYTVTPEATPLYSFTAQTITNLRGDGMLTFAGTLRTYTISGRVNYRGSGLSGVTMTLSGALAATTTTDAQGNYSFANLAAGNNYNITPAKLHYNFNPQSIAVTSLRSDTTTFFSAELKNYVISGRVTTSVGGALPVVQLELGGSATGLFFTGSNGDYAIPVAAEGNYTITPVRNAYIFAPVSRSFTNVTGNQSGVNFVGTLQVRSISGRVTHEGRGLPGVTMLLLGGQFPTTTTDANGGYRFENLVIGGNYTVIATRLNYVFSPVAQTFNNLRSDQTATDFIATIPPPSVQFDAADYQFDEGDARAAFTVTRTGDTSGTTTVDYQTIDTDTFTVGCFDQVNNQGGAFARCDFATAVGVLSFAPGETTKRITVPLIDDGHREGSETFSVRLGNTTGATLGTPSTTTATILDNDRAVTNNPVTTSFPFFVRQQYLDFLSREPDEDGSNAWLRVLNGCAEPFAGPSVPSGCDRTFVSGEGFFRSQEFQLKGFYVFRFYRLAFNRLPEYLEVVSDMSFVAGQTAEEVYARKAQLATLFTLRPEFQTAYGGMINAKYVSALMSRYNLQQVTTPDPANPDGGAKVLLTSADLTNKLDANQLTRAQVLRAVADSDEVGAQEFNYAFVGMQYYGYLRRKPDNAGFQAWLRVLQAGNVRTMVDGFLNSVEYKLRFGQP